MPLTSPIAGSAQTGAATPTFTFVDDARLPNGVQKAITVIGSTVPAGATAHSADKPFTLSVTRPANVRTQSVNANGVTVSTGRNRHNILVRKGMAAVSGQPALLGTAEAILAIPVGAESVSPGDIRAMVSCLIGALQQYSAALGDQAVTAVVTA